MQRLMSYDRDTTHGHREYWKRILAAVREAEETSAIVPDANGGISLDDITFEELERLTAPGVA